MPRQRKTRDLDGVYERPDSPYYWASYTDAGGQRVRRSTGLRKSIEGRREAEALLAKWTLEAHREKQWDEPPNRTFDELMLAYLKVAAADKRAGERDRYSLKHLYPVFTGRELQRITSVDVRSYIAARKQQGAAPATVNREIGLFSSAVNFANREWGWQLPNPAARCKQSEPEGRVRWLSRAEATALVRMAGQDPRALHLAAFIRLALHTGCRKGELLGLEWRRVDLQSCLIYLEAENTKTAKRRSVPLNREAREAMLERARFRAQHCPLSPWVFCHKDGTRILDVKRSFATACARVDITDFRIHDLRHTCAAWLVKEGVPLAEVRDLLGHATVQMTERYAHLAPDNIRAAVARLESTASRSGHVEKAG
jgi:integrase